MEIQKIYDTFLQSGMVTTDSRKITPGAIYFALKGERFNGNKFAIQALKEGCILAVVDDPALKEEPGCIWVPDALKALQETATMHRVQSEFKVIGITGSNGKTTTKELVAEVLSKKYNIWFTQGNLNNHIGVPLTLLSTPPGTKIVVVEMGANHQGEIAELCNIAQPDMGMITNVGKAHLEGFGSFAGVKIGKGEMYQYLTQKGGEIFINGNNQHLIEMLGTYNGALFRYGTDSDFEVTGILISANPLLSFKWSSVLNDGGIVDTNISGDYNLENALAAITIGLHFSVSPQQINEALENYQPMNHRSQLIKKETNTIVLDAYNANPTSMGAALDNFKNMQSSSKFLILGEMKELGNDSMTEHQALVKKAEKMDMISCFLIGNDFKEIMPDDDRFQWFEDAQKLISHLKTQTFRDSHILIKGSRANMLENIVEAL